MCCFFGREGEKQGKVMGRASVCLIGCLGDRVLLQRPHKGAGTEGRWRLEGRGQRQEGRVSMCGSTCVEAGSRIKRICVVCAAFCHRRWLTSVSAAGRLALSLPHGQGLHSYRPNLQQHAQQQHHKHQHHKQHNHQQQQQQYRQQQQQSSSSTASQEQQRRISHHAANATRAARCQPCDLLAAGCAAIRSLQQGPLHHLLHNLLHHLFRD